jgi:2-dehydro-3-deoxygluconokinase
MVDVTCLGEAMALLVPGPEPDDWGFAGSVGGAESNVACALAALGIPVRWVGRVGDDRFGRLVRDTLTAHGVETSAIDVDEARPTGLYVKELTSSGTRMRYYRAGSAASAMGPELAARSELRDPALLHLSGITPALSESCAGLVEAVLAERVPGRLVSFDVNWRPALWSGRDPSVLLDFARRADLVFVGADEAEALWGVGTPEDVRGLIPGPRTLVVKQGADGATAYDGDDTAFVAAPRVEVVEATGAGDAFAAGFLAATLRGLPLRSRLWLGTLTAGTVLRVSGDLGRIPSDIWAEAAAR